MPTLALLAVASTVHLAYWLFLRVGLRRGERQDDAAAIPKAELPPMTVVTTVHNEEDTLLALLEALSAQTHPRCEIVIVDDASTDRTAMLARSWMAGRENARLVQIPSSASAHKKHALTQGIRTARHDLLALTDADCTPPPDWLEALARRHAARPEDQVLIGYSPFRRGSGLLERLATYETFVTGVLTASAAGRGHPYMAVGRNLSYPKRVFEHIGGFSHSDDFICGDDDLFVQEVARRDAACIQPVFAAPVPSDAPPSWHVWLRSKRRHAAAGAHYPAEVTAHLAVLHGAGALLWTAPLWGGAIGLAALSVKLVGQGLVLREAAKALGERPLWAGWPLSDLLYAGYTLLAAPLGLVGVEEW